jgi:hypothetical protein
MTDQEKDEVLCDLVALGDVDSHPGGPRCHPEAKMSL